jgi:NTP pyrophosphatase (non-canonical NTP hydrolase)
MSIAAINSLMARNNDPLIDIERNRDSSAPEGTHVPPDVMRRVIIDVVLERESQDRKWGVQNHGPAMWGAILAEEVGEAAKAFLEDDIDGYRAELVQVAAVAVAAVECYDRHRAGQETGPLLAAIAEARAAD